CGACAGLDEYTVFLAPGNAADAGAADLAAAGLYLGVANNTLVVEGLTANSWVALTYPQLRRGDRVVSVNGKPTAGANLAGVPAAFRSPIENEHVLDVRFDDGSKLVVRVPLALPSVYGTQMMPDKPVGYTRIGHFQSSTPRELDEAIALLKTAGARAVVIDLRGNHGGSFLAAVETARRLLPTGLIVTTRGQVTEVADQVFSSSSGMSAHDIPVVLLIDAETASAAEVLAAALKDNGRATVVGAPSFGKGSVQYPQRLVALDEIDPLTGRKVSKSGTVRVTIAKLIAPTSGPLTGAGVAPDLVETDPTRQLELAAERAEEDAAKHDMRRLSPTPAPLPMLMTGP
ncbi:MAG: hypothetical protein K2X91_17975, partial [Thermoleophilia bacterium]|nr:hypothetical protein [Thermoleophilia bacterium]